MTRPTEVREFVFQQAGNAFAGSDDKAAQVLRELGNKLQLKEQAANERLEQARIDLTDYQENGLAGPPRDVAPAAPEQEPER